MTLPDHVYVVSQRVSVGTADNLASPSPHPMEDGMEDHTHRLYGNYDEGQQEITLDSGMGHERQRETFLHECLHAMAGACQLDSVLDGEAHGLAEHVVASLAPVLLAFVRDNPAAITYLQEEPA